MRKKTGLLLVTLTILIVVCDKRVAKRNSSTKPHHLDHENKKPSMVTRTNPISNLIREKRTIPNESKEQFINHQESSHKVRHHHEANSTNNPQGSSKRRKRRCKRQGQQYYQPYKQVPVYVPNQQNYLAPNYVPPQYVVPTYYSVRCRNYCVPCVTSTCRRRCPNYPTTTTAVTKPTAIITVTPQLRKSNSGRRT